MTDDKIVRILSDIRNWIKAASYSSVKASLETALPDAKTRAAYQMLDGNTPLEQVRVACKMSPNALLALTQRWVAMGLMSVSEEKKRIRVFDLADFDLADTEQSSTKRLKR